jgi:SAM-dependent methyltransferase
MFSKSAKYYDEIYTSMDKDYPGEAEKVHEVIEQHQTGRGDRLLDVGCGTGLHADLLSKYYQVTGLDLDPEMLAVARGHYPDIPFFQGDMAEFKLDSKFDVIVCLFSSIGYVKTKPRLRKTVKNLAQHLSPQGILLVEPWFTAAQWKTGRVTVLQVDKPELKIIRMSRSARKGNISIIEFQYLVGTPKGIEHQVEVHELGLFSKSDMRDAFRAASLKVSYDAEGLDGRGLYIGSKM